MDKKLFVYMNGLFVGTWNSGNHGAVAGVKQGRRRQTFVFQVTGFVLSDGCP